MKVKIVSKPKAENGLKVENNDFEYLSPQTINLGGSYHTDGGTDINYQGQTVEAEKNEPVSIDQTGAAVVWGNMHFPGSNTKFKQIGKDIAKQEKKIDKTKDKASYFLNEFDPNSKYQGYAFNTGSVMSDAYEQKNAKLQDVKQYVTDTQNQMLDLADRTGANPSKISNLFKGKAKYGMNLPKADNGAVLGEQQQMLKDHPEWVQEALTKYGKPRAGKFDDGLTGPRTDFVRNYVAKKQNDAIAPLPTTGPKSITLDNYYNGTVNPAPEPNVPYLPGQGETIDPLNTVQSYPASAPGQQPIAERAMPTNLMVTTPGKKIVKGLRNKFRPGQYIGEFMSMLDQPEQVPSMQVNPILESEYNMSLQSKKNAIQSAYTPALKNAANNPAVQAAISAQMAEQLGSVDSEELGLNQQNNGAIRARNAQELRGVRDTNLQLTNDQRNKTQMAKDNSKENRYRALMSLEQKEAQRRAQNNQLGMYENMAGWSYNPQQGYGMIHPDYQYQNTPLAYYDPSKDTTTTEKKKFKKGNEEITDTTRTKFFGGSMASRKKKTNYKC